MHEKQIIIDLSEPGAKLSSSGKVLKQKWDIMHPSAKDSCRVFSYEEFRQLNERLQSPPEFKRATDPKDTAKLRVYIIGHYSSKADEICLPGGQPISDKDIARVSNYLIHNRNATINLVSCKAGADNNNNSSYGAKLYRTINNLRKTENPKSTPVPVIARTTLAIIDPKFKRKVTLALEVDEKAYLKKEKQRGKAPKGSGEKKALTDELRAEQRHRQYGTKVAYTEKDGTIKKLDGYDFLWKERVISMLLKCKENTSVKEKKGLFVNWLLTFEKQTPEQIYQTLVHEKNKVNTVLNKHSNLFSQLIRKDPESFVEISKLIKEREKILAADNMIEEQDAERLEDLDNSATIKEPSAEYSEEVYSAEDDIVTRINHSL
ncbi:Uncharacterised protein [Legionella beliardensis]|uniref:Uncharacterized protein n=1 Tax=Legionella beliardensis TaxID=91822 RepID=A0A378I1G0_9GAMM|nr:hypothetical protein [Legionella beliardensis]STX28515.1 Uncharacterised protein [Legionella beliardensis]